MEPYDSPPAWNHLRFERDRRCGDVPRLGGDWKPSVAFDAGILLSLVTLVPHQARDGGHERVTTAGRSGEVAGCRQTAEVAVREDGESDQLVHGQGGGGSHGRREVVNGRGFIEIRLRTVSGRVDFAGVAFAEPLISLGLLVGPRTPDAFFWFLPVHVRGQGWR